MNESVQHAPTQSLPVSEQLDLLKRGVVDLISEDDLKARLETGKQLRVKLGADPTRPTCTWATRPSFGRCVSFRTWATRSSC